MAKTPVGHSYAATSPEEARDSYAAWATAYETDLMAMGYRLP